MKKILLIESSPRGSDSYSHQAARFIVNELQRRNPGTKVVVRDLGQSPPPHVGQAFHHRDVCREHVLTQLA